MGKQKSKGEFFVEPRLRDSDTNEIIVDGLNQSPGLSEEYEQKEYKGKHILVYKVNYDFITGLYRNKAKWNLKFRIFIEVNGSLRLWELFRPDVMKKARVAREAWKKGRKGIKYDKSDR